MTLELGLWIPSTRYFFVNYKQLYCRFWIFHRSNCPSITSTPVLCGKFGLSIVRSRFWTHFVVYKTGVIVLLPFFWPMFWKRSSLALWMKLNSVHLNLQSPRQSSIEHPPGAFSTLESWGSHTVLIWFGIFACINRSCWLTLEAVVLFRKLESVGDLLRTALFGAHEVERGMGTCVGFAMSQIWTF
jgi:hypothetical protein